MARPVSKFPTELELAVLNVMWANAEPMRIGQIRDGLEKGGRRLAYTTALTTARIMMRKGYLKRKVLGNGLYHVYLATLKQEIVRKAMLLDVVSRAYQGDVEAAKADL